MLFLTKCTTWLSGSPQTSLSALWYRLTYRYETQLSIFRTSGIRSKRLIWRRSAAIGVGSMITLGYAESLSGFHVYGLSTNYLDSFCHITTTGYGSCGQYEPLRQRLDIGVKSIYNRIPASQKKQMLSRIRHAASYLSSRNQIQKTLAIEELFALSWLGYRVQQYLMEIQPKLSIREGGGYGDDVYGYQYGYQGGYGY